MRAFAVVSFLVASAVAYTITNPSPTQGWNNDGAQTLSWQRVDTDAANFTAVLFNPATQKQDIIAQTVDGKLSTLKVNPPSAGWPSGSGFRVRLIRDPQSLTSILAESQDFNITDVPLASRTATTAAGTTPTGSSPAGSDPTKKPGAASSLSVQTGLVAAVSLLGFAALL